MAGDLGPARHVMRCRLLRGDDVLMMAPCQCVLSSRSGRMGAADCGHMPATASAHRCVSRTSLTGSPTRIVPVRTTSALSAS